MRTTKYVILAMAMLLWLTSAAVVHGGLVAYYSFEDGTPSDSAGGHDGFMYGDAHVVADAPTGGGIQSVYLDGAADSVKIFKDGWWNNTTFANGITVCYWGKIAGKGLNNFMLPFSAVETNGYDLATYYFDAGGYYYGAWYGGDSNNSDVDPFEGGSWEVLLEDLAVDPYNQAGQWHHYAFTYDRSGHLAYSYKDGVLLSPGSGSNTVAEEINFVKNAVNYDPYGSQGLVVLGGDARFNYDDGYWVNWYGWMDELAIFDGPLSTAQIAGIYASGVQYTPLVPDDFERYADTVALDSRWNSTGLMVLETAVVHGGNKAMKNVFATAGSATQEESAAPVNGVTFNYAARDGQNLSVWILGVVGQTGDVTLKLLDSSDVTQATRTLSGGMGVTAWTELSVALDASTNDLTDIKKVVIEASAAGTLYADDLGFTPSTRAPQKVVEWAFNQTSGLTALDTSGNSLPGQLGPAFTGGEWVIDGGQSGETGDHALQFNLDPNYSVIADNVTLPANVKNIFDRSFAWTVNQWIYLDQESTEGIFGGFGGGLGLGSRGTERYLITSDYFGLGHNELYLFIQASDINTNVQFDVGQWQMITTTYDPATARLNLYKNATLVGSRMLPLADTVSRIAVSPNARLGTLPAAESFVGRMDDFCVWDGALPLSDEDEDPTNDIVSLWQGWICQTPPAFDANGDCVIDLQDFAAWASTWLDCGRFPASYCP